MSNNKQPIYLNLLQIKLPANGINSVLHRISGFLMTLGLPFVIYLFGLSIQNESGFYAVKILFTNIFIKIILILLLWSLIQHILSGIRFLLLDFEIGISKKYSLLSAGILNIVSILSIIILTILMFKLQ